MLFIPCRFALSYTFLAQDQPISDLLIAALEIASRTNPATRETEPLTSYLQNCQTFNETEAIGTLKVLVLQTQLGQAAMDGCLLEFMRCLIRLDKAKAFPDLVKALCSVFQETA